MGDRAPFRYLIANRVNALVWALPTPRRVKALLSRIVYQNPPMPTAIAVRTLAALEAAGIVAVLMGGWGVDALVGEQLRVHHDLDLIVDHTQLDLTLMALGALGFREWFRNPDPAPFGESQLEGSIAVRDAAMRVIDLHPLHLDVDGPALAPGDIGGHPVTCLAPKVQIEVNARSQITTRSNRETQRYQANLEAARKALRGGVLPSGRS